VIPGFDAGGVSGNVRSGQISRALPSARTAIADVARAQPALAGVARLATLVGLTR